MVEPKTPCEAAAAQLLAAGGTRHEAGAVVTLQTGTKVRVVSGWAAVRASRVLCTGKLEVVPATSTARAP